MNTNPAENRQADHHDYLVGHYNDEIVKAHAPILRAIEQVEAALEAARKSCDLTADQVDGLTAYLADLRADLEWITNDQIYQSVAYVEGGSHDAP